MRTLPSVPVSIPFIGAGAYDDTALNDRVDENAAAINGFGRRLDDLEEDLSAGIAMSMAMQTPTISPGKDLNLSIGAGFYNGQKAVAVSFGARIDENGSINGGIGFDASRRDIGLRIGTSFEF